jgi:hypothetical protein
MPREMGVARLMYPWTGTVAKRSHRMSFGVFMLFSLR